MSDVRTGETDGVGWMRRAVSILLEHDLPSFPRAAQRVSLRGRLPADFDPFAPSADRQWHWHASPDVAAQLRSLHVPGLPPPPPGMAEELFGYRVDVDEAYPAGTLEIVQDHTGVVVDHNPAGPIVVSERHEWRASPARLVGLSGRRFETPRGFVATTAAEPVVVTVVVNPGDEPAERS